MSELRDLVAEELSLPVDPRVRDMAAAIAAKHGDASRAVLFYGSCLRQKQLEGLMLDFYLIVSDYRAAYTKRWLAVANRLIPPNVFYFEHGGLVAKYAVLSEADFARECSSQARSTSVWARFAQPARLVWVADEVARDGAIDAVSECGPTLLALTRPTMTGEERNDPLPIYRAGFALTYGAELRAERKGKSQSIVDVDGERYERFGRAIMRERPAAKERALPKDAYKSGFQQGAVRVRARSSARQRWRLMQWKGKALSVARLAKASLTFAGGAEYIAWKINRHAGTDIQLKPWQRRHPLLAGLSLLPRLLKSGAVR
jgi:hypothetical protein